MVQFFKVKWMVFVLTTCLFGVMTPAALLGQCSQSSTDGYTVNMEFTIANIIPSSASCDFGYNYNLEIDYEVTFSGTNIPANLFTLQGIAICGGDQHFFDLPNSGGTGTVTSGSNPYRNAADCNTATPASLNCTDVDITISGSGLSNTVVDCNPSTLPIQLGGFTAKSEPHGVHIAWTTLTEINNDYFTIERSADGVHYETLAIIPGAGNSQTVLNYDFLDNQPLKGAQYYRLQQTDFDGQTTAYGPLVVYHNEDRQELRAVVQPGTNAIQIFGENIQDYDMEVVSLQGVTHYHATIRSAHMALPGVTTGTYVVRFIHRPSGQYHVGKLVFLTP